MFLLLGDDFTRIGTRIGALRLPTLLVQEGGYDLDVIGRNVVNVCAASRARNRRIRTAVIAPWQCGPNDARIGLLALHEDLVDLEREDRELRLVHGRATETSARSSRYVAAARTAACVASSSAETSNSTATGGWISTLSSSASTPVAVKIRQS